MSNGQGLPEKGKNSCWPVALKITFTTKGNSLVIPETVSWSYLQAVIQSFKNTNSSATYFPSFVKLKFTFYLLKIAISKLIILRRQTKYKQ